MFECLSVMGIVDIEYNERTLMIHVHSDFQKWMNLENEQDGGIDWCSKSYWLIGGTNGRCLQRCMRLDESHGARPVRLN